MKSVANQTTIPPLSLGSGAENYGSQSDVPKIFNWIQESMTMQEESFLSGSRVIEDQPAPMRRRRKRKRRQVKMKIAEMWKTIVTVLRSLKSESNEEVMDDRKALT